MSLMYVTAYKLLLVFPKRWYSFTSQIILPYLIRNKIRQSTLPGKEESNYIFGEINKMGKSPQYINTKA